MTVGKIKSLTENKIRNSLFFTNTKTMEFIKFSLFNFFSKNVISERHLLYTHQCHWLGCQGGGRKTPTGTILNTLLFSLECCRLCHPFHVREEKAWRQAVLPHRVWLWYIGLKCILTWYIGTQIWKYCKSNYKWNCNKVALLDTVSLANICILHLPFVFHI